MGKSSWLRPRWRHARRLVQLLFLALFLFLFRGTELGRDEVLPHANLFFRLDPLVAASAMLAARAFIAALALSHLLLVLTALFGRFFCGWVCPLGTLLDGLGWVVGGRDRAHHPPRRAWRPVRHILLIAILVAAAFSLPLVGYLDPFAVLTRGLAFAVDPFLSRASSSVFDWLYFNAAPSVSYVSETVYDFLRDHVLAFKQATLAGAAVAAGTLLAIFLLEFVERRFWCRNLCPLGSLLTLVARFAPLGRTPPRACPNCQQCAQACRMDAFNSQGKLETSACTLCMDCVDDCPHSIATLRFGFRRRSAGSTSGGRTAQPTDLSRRALLTGCTLGLALPAAVAVARRIRPAVASETSVLRPPGVTAAGFLDRCVRCGECLKVCPTNALQPDMTGGFEGLFAPRLVPRIGYCEYNCTLCNEVCPSGAIPPLDLPAKQHSPVGLAIFDETRCLPYASNTPCLVCEAHCPIPDKAIRTRSATITAADGTERTLLRPYVIHRLCIGCGICENKCPLSGPAGVRVQPHAYPGQQRQHRRYGRSP